MAKNTCDRVSLEAYEDKTGPGPETITWRDAASDPYKYFLYVNAFNGDFARSGVKISIYDDKTTPIKMEVPEGATVGDRWGSFQMFDKTQEDKSSFVYECTYISFTCILILERQS